jgi:hypothetical protein
MSWATYATNEHLPGRIASTRPAVSRGSGSARVEGFLKMRWRGRFVRSAVPPVQSRTVRRRSRTRRCFYRGATAVS